MRNLILIMIISSAFLFSCKQKTSQEVRPAEQFTTPMIDDEIVNSSVTDGQGNTLEMSFNNTKNTAILKLNGEVISMKNDTTASGVRLSNDEYNYEEWHGHIILRKNGKVVFDNHYDPQVKSSVTNKKGEVLNLEFDDDDTATLQFKGETIVLKADTMASGLRYRNREYAYEEWQGHSVLKRNGEIIFDSHN